MSEGLRLALEGLPRVHLLDLPTPLEECPRLAEHLGGPRILMKRDDLTGLALGGNKSRRLEYVLADALAEGADTIVFRGRVHSNHARQLSAAAARLGLRAHLLLAMQDEGHPVLKGNLFLDDLLGADTTVVMLEDAHRCPQILQVMLDGTRRDGHTPYLVNSRRAELLGGAAHAAGAAELITQLDAMRVKADYVWMASAGGTLAGHLVAGKAAAYDWKPVAQAYDPMPTEDHVAQRREEIATLATDVSALLSLNLRVAPQDVTLLSTHVGQTFAEATPSSVEAVRLVARTEGILLDPLHTGRAMASLIEGIRRGHIGQGETVVFVHTGGAPNIFPYSDALAPGHWDLFEAEHT